MDKMELRISYLGLILHKESSWTPSQMRGQLFSVLSHVWGYLLQKALSVVPGMASYLPIDKEIDSGKWNDLLKLIKPVGRLFWALVTQALATVARTMGRKKCPWKLCRQVVSLAGKKRGTELELSWQGQLSTCFLCELDTALELLLCHLPCHPKASWALLLQMQGLS